MDEKKEDRRVRRTRRLLKQGLAELMEEKDFKDITVKDITDRVDLNRGTFYLHYADTYDLLEKLENETLQDFQSMIDAHVPQTEEEQDLTPILLPIARYIVDNASVCRSLFENRASNDFLQKFQQTIHDNGQKIIRGNYPRASSQNLRYFFCFITYGLIGLIREWFTLGMTTTIEDLVSKANRIITATADAILR